MWSNVMLFDFSLPLSKYDSDFHMKNKSLHIHLKSKYLSFKDLAPTIEVGKIMTDFY